MKWKRHDVTGADQIIQLKVSLYRPAAASAAATVEARARSRHRLARTTPSQSSASPYLASFSLSPPLLLPCNTLNSPNAILCITKSSSMFIVYDAPNNKQDTLAHSFGYTQPKPNRIEQKTQMSSRLLPILIIIVIIMLLPTQKHTAQRMAQHSSAQFLMAKWKARVSRWANTIFNLILMNSAI